MVFPSHNSGQKIMLHKVQCNKTITEWGRCGAVAKTRNYKGDGCGFDSHSEEFIIIYLYFYFFALVTRQSKASQNSVESGEQCLDTRTGKIFVSFQKKKNGREAHPVLPKHR